ncbi:hypothetical protein LJN56_03455 [Cellulomonas sp. zg-Y908]|nr:hypothetical protein [Cellulomonas wangsupingiae]
MATAPMKVTAVAVAATTVPSSSTTPSTVTSTGPVSDVVRGRRRPGRGAAAGPGAPSGRPGTGGPAGVTPCGELTDGNLPPRRAVDRASAGTRGASDGLPCTPLRVRVIATSQLTQPVVALAA